MGLTLLAFIAPHATVPGYTGYSDAWLDGSAGGVNLASYDLASAAECGVACDTKQSYNCLSFSWRPSDGRCVLHSAGRSHSGYRCCACGTSSNCEGFDFYELYSAPPSPPKPPPRPPGGGCGNVDVMLVLDRSNNYNAKSWNTLVIPTLKSVVNGVGPSATTNTKLGVVVYPAANGNRGDVSGDAKLMVSLSHSRTTVDRLIGDVESSVQISGVKHCAPNPSSSLEWPCGGWKFGWALSSFQSRPPVPCASVAQRDPALRFPHPPGQCGSA